MGDNPAKNFIENVLGLLTRTIIGRFPSSKMDGHGLEHFHFHFHLNMDSNENVLAGVLLLNTFIRMQILSVDHLKRAKIDIFRSIAKKVSKKLEELTGQKPHVIVSSMHRCPTQYKS